MERQNSGILFKLFTSTFYLSAFTFGGGYVIVTLLKDRFVDQYHWIDEDEMLDMVAIAQSAPGPIAVNGAVVIGYKMAGIPGALTAVLGAVIPPMVILSLVSMCYDAFRANPYIAAMLSGMRAGVGAVIASVVWDMGKRVVKAGDPVNIILMLLSFCASYFGGVNVIFILIAAAPFGMGRTIAAERFAAKAGSGALKQTAGKNAWGKEGDRS